MSRVFRSALSQYLQTSTPPVLNSSQSSISAWAYPTSVASQQGLVAIQVHNATGLDGFGIRWISSLTKLGAYAQTGGGGGFGEARGGVLVANKWQHVAGVWAARNSRKIYLDGVSQATETTDVFPEATNDRLTIGAEIYANAVTDFFSGYLAEVCLFAGALTDLQVLALSRGVSPYAIGSVALDGYIPLWGIGGPDLNLTKYSVGPILTAYNGPITRGPHPFMLHYPVDLERRAWPGVGAGPGTGARSFAVIIG